MPIFLSITLPNSTEPLQWRTSMSSGSSEFSEPTSSPTSSRSGGEFDHQHGLSDGLQGDSYVVGIYGDERGDSCVHTGTVSASGGEMDSGERSSAGADMDATDSVLV